MCRISRYSPLAIRACPPHVEPEHEVLGWEPGPGTRALPGVLNSHNLTQTFLASVKKSSDSNPPSRPRPLSFIPPKGTRRSRSSQVLTHTVPLSIAPATRWAFWRSRVQTLAESP